MAGERPAVTKESIYRRALQIVDSEGLDALTMRRLAADLGIEAASLYHHVPNKQAVLDGAVGVMRSEIVLPDPIPTEWREIMQVVFEGYLDLLIAHPHMLPMAARHVESDPAEGLPFLIQTGLGIDDAIAVWQSVMAFVVGYATFASHAIVGDVEHLGPDVAERMRRWDRNTAARGLQAILAAYHVSPGKDGATSAVQRVAADLAPDRP